MKQGGDQLDIPREVDFAVIFPSEAAAMDFALRLLRYGGGLNATSIGFMILMAPLPGAAQGAVR